MTTLARAVRRYGITSLRLLIVDNSAALSPIGLMIVAVALGVSVALLSYHIAKAAGLGPATAMVLAAIALFAATAGTLGGMRPLIDGLDGVGFTVGKHRLSLLGVVNVIVVAVLFVVARIVNRILVHSIGRLHTPDLSRRVLAEPKPSMWLKDFGAGSVDRDILVWIADPELGVGNVRSGNVRSDVLNRVWMLFRDNRIEIQFPQQDVHIRSMPKVQTRGET